MGQADVVGGGGPSFHGRQREVLLWAASFLSVNHQTGPHLSEIPLRLLLLQLLEIYLVCGKEPHFHVGTDGAKLSLTETDNSKTEI